MIEEKEATVELMFSYQAMGAFMMLLQKSLAEESDIVPGLMDLRFGIQEVDETTDELVCLNPPVVIVDAEGKEV